MGGDRMWVTIRVRVDDRIKLTEVKDALKGVEPFEEVGEIKGEI